MTRHAIEMNLSPASSPATGGHRVRATVVCLTAAIATLLLMPSAASAWPQLPAFVPVYQTVVIVGYAITAYLLWGSFRAARSTALLFLGAGCLYTALILLAQLLSFPGQFGPAGLVSGGPQTTIWLWAFWHLGPPVFMLAYAVFEWRYPNHQTSHEQARQTGVVAALMVLALVALNIAVVTWGHDWLPPLNRGNDFSLMTTSGVAPAIQALTVVALAVHWRVTRLRTILQVWMAVALFALLVDNAITMMGAARFTVGWYVGRLNALLSALVLLCVYLREIRALYARLASAAVALAEHNDVLEQRVLERTRDLVTAVEEKEVARAQADKAAADRSAFLSSASHDLRQPFQAMRLFHTLLDERVTDDDVNQKLMHNLDKAMRAGEELLTALLDVSTLDAGLVTPALKSVEVRALLDEVADECRPMAVERGLSLSVAGPSTLIETDPVLLKRAIRNLIHNAVRFARPTGRILIAGRRHGDAMLLQVWDNGIGIPADKQTAVFEDFVQLGNPERDRAKGLGLGLSVVKRTAALLGGKIALRSNIGSGSVFTMCLPAAAPSVVVLERPPLPPQATGVHAVGCSA